MITPAEFELAQRILSRPDRERPSKHEFPYAGLLRCARCGRVLTPEKHIKKKSGRVYAYYRCRARAGKEACRMPLLPETHFEEHVMELLGRLSLSPEARTWIAANIASSLSQAVGQRDAARVTLLRAIGDTRREGENLLQLRLRDQVDDATYEKQRVEILERQAMLELKLTQPEARPDELMGRVDRMLDFAASAPAAFLAAKDNPVRRRIILQAVAANSSVNGRSVQTLAKEPFSILERGSEFPLWLRIVEDLRTWVLTKSDGFRLPDLNLHRGEGIQSQGS